MSLLFHRTVSLCAVLAGILIFFVCGVTFFEIVTRYAFGAPTTWSIDISTYAIFWATFLGGAHCLREGGHVAVDVLVRWLGTPAQRGISTAVYGSLGVFSGLVAWRGGVACLEAYEFGEVTMSVLRFPLYLPLSAIPLGSTLIAIQAFVLAGQSRRAESEVNQ